jgi:hypothetical protein
MRRVRDYVERSGGQVQFLPLTERWAVAGRLADTFPLDRELARAPRSFRQGAHWIRLLLVDRAVTNPERTAVFTISDTPWVPAVTAAVAAAIVAPRLPRWLRWAAYGGVAVWALWDGRAARYLAMHRDLARVAPGSVILADFLTTESGAAIEWAADAMTFASQDTQLVALVPVSGNARRDAARERMYVRRLGFQVVGRTRARGQEAAILVRG